MPIGSARLILAAFVVLALGIAACGGPDSLPPPTSSPAASPTPINPQALLLEAGKVMESVESFAFKMEHASGWTPLPILPGLQLQEAEGEVVKPDKISARFNGTVRNSLFIKSNLITLGDMSYMTNPISGKWESIPADVSPLGFFNPSEGVSAMMTQVEGAILIQNGGPDTHVIEGILPAEALAPLFGETIKGTFVEVELTIDSENLYLIKAVLNGRITEEEEDGVIRIVTLSRFNEPLIIEPPQL